MFELKLEEHKNTFTPKVTIFFSSSQFETLIQT